MSTEFLKVSKSALRFPTVVSRQAGARLGSPGWQENDESFRVD